MGPCLHAWVSELLQEDTNFQNLLKFQLFNIFWDAHPKCRWVLLAIWLGLLQQRNDWHWNRSQVNHHHQHPAVGNIYQIYVSHVFLAFLEVPPKRYFQKMDQLFYVSSTKNMIWIFDANIVLKDFQKCHDIWYYLWDFLFRYFMATFNIFIILIMQKRLWSG